MTVAATEGGRRRREVMSDPVAFIIEVPRERRSAMSTVLKSARDQQEELLDGGQEQPDQDGDDRDDHEQFDQREPCRPRPRHTRTLRALC